MNNVGEPVVEIQTVSNDGTYGKFVAHPLERGFGNTLGNSLRRVLLSLLPGVAVTAVKIDGILHEFSVIPGVKEDVVQIILNLKGLKVKLYSDSSKTLTINTKGPKVLTAGSIEHDGDVEILDPNMYIATLNKDADLHMEIVIEKGRGYVPAEFNKPKSEEYGVGTIPIDSIYTPVTKVNYIVENTRVGQKIDYDKLLLEVWTNGVLRADESVSIASNILTQYLKLYSNIYTNAEQPGFSFKTNEDTPKSRFSDMTIEDLDLSVRSSNCLKRVGIDTVSKLARMSENEIAKVRNMGKKSLEEVKAKLALFGIIPDSNGQI
ncbi:MAG: DNA-directed RNA polymerase subunit alpha [Oscillospiraceae bacterium]|nr:DNA-directed RNA polymerase subunit alpha [Oscillospiraceae bacterium]